MEKTSKNTEYKTLIDKIGVVYQQAKKEAITAVHTKMLIAYWEVGRYIIEFEQEGKLKAEVAL